MLRREENKEMNEELLKELISEIKELNTKIDILLSDNSFNGYTNLQDIYNKLCDIYIDC